MFKPKNDYKIQIKNNMNTLDNRHEELINEFILNKEEIPKLEEKINSLKSLKNKELEISKRLEYQDEIKLTRNKIRNLKKAHTDYLLKNSEYIFEYFETKKNISMGVSKKTILNNFFKKTKGVEEGEKNCNDLINKYMQNIDPNYVNLNNFIHNSDVCSRCRNGELVSIDNEGVSMCNKCGYFVKFLTENEKSSYKDPPKEVCYYVYKRINHFKEILAQFQAKETTHISEEVMEKIKHQIKKERIKKNEITNEKTKDILKKLGYSNYYEHISFIKEKLGIKPPTMTPELEEKLCNLFIQIQAPYSKYCPEDRVNFLNYYYTIYKLCELINQREFLLYFPMLKDRDKRVEQDEIWKKICEELGWKFIPTL